MQPSNRSAAAKLQDPDVTEGAQLGKFVSEMQHAVDHRVFREESAAALGVGQKDHRASHQTGERLEVVNEGLELTFGGSGLLSGDQAVDDEQRGPMLLNRASDQRDE